MTNEFVSKQLIEIKPLQIIDIEQLEPILRQHICDYMTREPIEEEIAAVKRYMKGEQDEYGRVRNYFVAKSTDGKVIGCMASTTMDPDMEKHFSELNPNETIELVNAFVDNNYRGGGVGKKLFDNICSLGRSQGKKHLTVNSGPRYHSSRKFYDHVCDQDCGFIADKYGPRVNAKTWIKTL